MGTGQEMADHAAANPEIVANPDRSRYELRLDGELVGVADYIRAESVDSFIHTETVERYRGRGLAAQLIEFALARSRADGREILPYCSFVSEYITAHPEYLELVPAERRGEFRLPVVVS
jgi:predicted GNAT family acetyltransferase